MAPWAAPRKIWTAPPPPSVAIWLPRGTAHVAVLKSVVTQASSAIPVMPLYISMAFKIMKEKGIHEGCMEQVDRMMRTRLYGADHGAGRAGPHPHG